MEAKSIFQMTNSELHQALLPVAEAIRKRAWKKNGYISYYDEALCPDTDFLVREYSDKKELIRLNDKGEAEVVCTL